MIELKLTVEEVNIVLNALASRPYGEVCELIAKITADGEKQLHQNNNDNEQKEV